MGTSSTLNFLDSTAYAAMWAVLSTDSGSNMVMNVYNSTLQLTRAVETNVAIQADGGQITTYDNPYTTNYGSGYGTYVIGSVEENMVGVTMNVGTYAAIFTGGSMSFSTLTAGDYTLSNADGSTTAYTYSGNARSSVINSDTFGFMAHQGDNTLTLNSGTALNTGYTGFLIKTGGSLSSFTANVTGTSISVGNNVLIQILDNEDSLIGTSSGTTFVTTYTESSGWLSSSSSSGDSGDSGDSGSGGESGGGPGGGESGGGPGGSGGNQGSGISTIATTASSSSDSVVFNFTNESALTGNIYNASGDQLTGTGVTVNLSGTTYYGAAASTTAIHVTYDGSQYVKNTLNGYAVEEDDDGTAVLAYQNTSITISEYYDLGHVANKICSNGSNTVTINLTDNSTWYVTGTSVLSSLSVDSTSQVILVGDATLTVNGTTYDADNLGDNMSHVDSLDDEEECDHVWDDGEVTTEATCTEDGEITYTCTLCGETKTETIEATGHTAGEAVTENEVAASCTEDGSYDTVVYCTVCGEEISRETTTVAATGHSYEAVVTAPTCTAGGYTTYTCTICGDSYVADETEATGHTWNDGEVTTAATCTEEGVMTYTCTTCGETKTEAIAATGHTEGEAVTENEVSATCTEDGSYDTVIYCTVCDAEISRET
ncbi:MAG: hypothetical protein LUE22_07705, partial [Oscillospiraceae bacterium]|nr:hypothetical protein [Oscillospiraceae bacterium]